MHEWALAESVVATVQKAVREHGGLPVRAVRVSIGELQAVDLEAFRAGLEAALSRAGAPAEGIGRGAGPGAALSADLFAVHLEKVSFGCNRCGAEWLLDSVAGLGEEEREAIHFLPETAHAVLRCPACGSPDFQLKGGRGVSIQSIDLEAPE